MITIPTNWSVEQADSVDTFLQSIIYSIWEIYGDRLVEMQQQDSIESPHIFPDMTHCQWDDVPPF